MNIHKISDYKGINIFIDSKGYDDYSIFYRIEQYFGLENIHIFELYEERKSKILPTHKIHEYTQIHGGIEFEYLSSKQSSIKKLSCLLKGKEFLEIMTECIFGKLDYYKFCLTEKLFILDHFAKEEYMTLLITKEKTLIKKREQIYHKIPNINIVDRETAEEILGLFVRANGLFFLHRDEFYSKGVDRGLYYLYSYRYYNSYFLKNKNQLDLTNEILFKGESIIKTLDELGFLYYGGVNNSTSFDTKYYFYYYLVLVCGIYDKLSTYINRVQNLNLNETTLSLNSQGSGYEEFIEKIQSEELKNILTNNKSKIDLVYKMRNLIVHTEGLPNINVNGIVGALKVDTDIRSLLLGFDKSCYDKDMYLNGLLKNEKLPNSSFLVPFIFSKFCFKIFFEILNGIFKELGNNKFIDTLNIEEDFYQQLEKFDKNFLKLNIK